MWLPPHEPLAPVWASRLCRDNDCNITYQRELHGADMVNSSRRPCCWFLRVERSSCRHCMFVCLLFSPALHRFYPADHPADLPTARELWDVCCSYCHKWMPLLLCCCVRHAVLCCVCATGQAASAEPGEACSQGGAGEAGSPSPTAACADQEDRQDRAAWVSRDKAV